jgi:hypothetical protein
MNRLRMVPVMLTEAKKPDFVYKNSFTELLC